MEYEDMLIHDAIWAGATFILKTNAMPNGAIGSIYPDRLLIGVFQQNGFAWTVTGPNGPSGNVVTATYCVSGCANVGNQIDPQNGLLNIWGHEFNMDGNGRVFEGNQVCIGRVTIVLEA